MRILIINRLHDEFSNYGRYIDHERHQVSYVTVAEHLPLISPSCRHVEVIDDPDDANQITVAAKHCHAALGHLDKVLALSEFDLLVAAQIRDELSVPGMRTAAMLLFRDKVRMKQVIADAGYRIPAYRAIKSREEVASFVRDHQSGIVVKPRAGAASAGCFILPSGADTERDLPDIDLSNYQVEEFLEGPIWHVDGLMQHGRRLLAVASRYINTCYGFAHGSPLGSVVQTGPLADRVSAFAVQCLTALGLRAGAFHVEVIEHHGGLVFLEVGARVGGGEIPFVLHEVYDEDLVGDWIRAELGGEPQTVPIKTLHTYAGFLMLPEPMGQRICSRSSMLQRIPELYAEVLPAVGHVFDGTGGYDTILGRFRYRGATARAVEQAIHTTLANYEYRLEDAASEARDKPTRN